MERSNIFIVNHEGEPCQDGIRSYGVDATLMSLEQRGCSIHALCSGRLAARIRGEHVKSAPEPYWNDPSRDRKPRFARQAIEQPRPSGGRTLARQAAEPTRVRRLFFPDERAAEFTAALRRQWGRHCDAHP